MGSEELKQRFLLKNGVKDVTGPTDIETFFNNDHNIFRSRNNNREVLETFFNIKLGTSVGYNGTSEQHLRSCYLVVVPTHVLFINMSVEEGTFTKTSGKIELHHFTKRVEKYK